jgi:hypothetical protein
MGLPLTADRVYSGARASRNLPDERMPAIRVHTPSEQMQSEGTMLGRISPYHRITVRLEVVAKDPNEVENIVDDICEQVEGRFDTDPTLGGAVVQIDYQSTDIDFEDEDQLVMQATLTYEAEFIQE